MTSQEALRRYYAALGYDPRQAAAAEAEVTAGAKSPSDAEVARNKFISKIVQEGTKKGLNSAFGSTLPTTAAANVAYNQAAGVASQAAWNAGATAATSSAANAGTAAQAAYNASATAASTGASATGMAAANAANAANAGGAVAAAPAAGTPGFAVGAPSYAGYLAAAMGLYNDIKNFKNHRDEMHATKAGQAAALAVANVYTGGLAGMAEGYARGQWGGTMSKLDKLDQKTNPVSILAGRFATDAWKKEGNRIGELQKQGLKIDTTGMVQQVRGRTKKQLTNPELAKDFRGTDAKYGWVNNKFANSRKEEDLAAGDITGYAFLPEKFGQQYLDAAADRKNTIADMLLKAGAVKEAKGSMDYTESFTPDLENRIKNYLATPVAPVNTRPIPRTGRGPSSSAVKK